MDKKIKPIHKILPVIRTLFGTAIRKYPGFFAMEVLKTVIDMCCPFLVLVFTPLLVDELCNDRDIAKLIIYAAILVIGEAGLNILLELTRTQLSKYQQRLDDYFSMKLGMHSMGLDFQLTEDKKALDQLDKAQTGMSWYSGGVYGIAEQVFMFIGNILKITGFTTLIAINAPWLLVVVISYVIVGTFFMSKCNKAEIISYEKRALSNRMFSYFGWTMVDFRYGKDIRLYNAKSMITNRWMKYTKMSDDAWKWQANVTTRYQLFAAGTKIVTTFLTFLYTGALAVNRVISAGGFTQMIEAAGDLDKTMVGLMWNIQELMKRCNYAYEYVLFMNYPEAMVKGTDNVKQGMHRIEFRDVSFAYPGTQRKVLDRINITIEPGEKLSIVGLNGAGKTTFIKLLCRLYDPTEGSIYLDGKDIRELDLREYMEQLAPVFQDFKLFGFSIGENIIFKEIEDRTSKETQIIEGLIKQVELGKMTEKLSKGIDNTVFKIFDEDGVEPSGGEQQKLAIARALYKDAPIIILDEPTAALDPVAEYEIYLKFHELIGDKTAFYISHRLSSCKFCDKIAVFQNGKIAEYGNHDMLVAIKNGIYAKMFEAQAQYYR